MKEGDLTRLGDALESVQFVHRYTADMDFRAFAQNPLVQDAVVRQIMILSESLKRVSPESKEELSEVPFQQIKGMRNRLVHEFGNINLSKIWSAATQEIPKIKEPIRKLINAYLNKEENPSLKV